MAKKSQANDGSRKNGTSRRTRAGKTNRQQGTPRIMIAALVVVVVGAALLFWPKGGSTPTGIGEQHSVVTSPDSTGTGQHSIPAGTPQSGDVDINNEGLKMTPETPKSEAKKNNEVEKPAEKSETKPAEKPVEKPVVKKKSKPKPAAPAIEPSSDGRWAVQAGGFGDAANADREADRLAKAGWQAMVRTGNNSNGDMVYRVWIGYFSSRDQANAFISQNRKTLADAYPVHR